MKKYLDAAKAKQGFRTDYQLAKAMGIPTSMMTRYRAEQGAPDTFACIKLAELAGLNPMEVISAAELARTKDEAKREYWRVLLKKCSSTAASATLITAALGATADPSSAEQKSSSTETALYIMLNRLMGLLRRRRSTPEDITRAITPLLQIESAIT